MEFVPAVSALSFEVTYDDSSLNVGMSVFDVTSGTPELVSGPVAMTNLPGFFTYFGTFTPENNKQYVIVKAVYTDVSLETLNQNYSQGSESIAVQNVVQGQIEIARNEPLDGFQFIMFSETSGDPLPGLEVTATRSIDGGAFAACANSVVEIGSGWYKIDLAATDLDGTAIALNFFASTAERTAATIITQA